MDNLSAAKILEAMLNGVHPVTGESLPDDHLCCDPSIMRALYTAIRALEAERHNAPSASVADKKAAVLLWTEKDDLDLTDACSRGLSADVLSQKMQRSETSIRNRMVYLGLLPSPNSTPGLEHHGLPWYPEEEALLIRLFKEGYSVKEIAAKMRRNTGGISSRLVKLGLIEKKH